MTEAERQSRAYAEVRTRLFGATRPVNIIGTKLLEKKKDDRKERIRITRWKELRRETEAHRRLQQLNLTLEAFDEIMVEIRLEQRASAETRIPMPMIARAVLADYPQFTMSDIRGPDRYREIVNVRKEIIRSIHRIRPDLSTVQIGKFINRDHSTVVHALGKRQRVYDGNGNEAQT